MASDALGNDVSAVGIPISGFMGYAPSGTAFPTASGGIASPLTLDPAFAKIGLIVEDGGFEWTEESNGDPIEFWQDGYYTPTGLANVKLVVKAAQYNEIVRKVTFGRVADGNGYIQIDGGGHADRYVLFTEEIFKNGVIRRRVAADAGVVNAKRDQSKRGEVNGTELTFEVARSALLGGNHVGEWLIPAPAGVIPVITAVTPTAQGAGQTVTITASAGGLTAATAVKFAGVTAPMFLVNSDTQITATLPPGSAGSAPVTIVNAAGTSAGFAYTRVV
jgi:hypothetical protein